MVSQYLLGICTFMPIIISGLVGKKYLLEHILSSNLAVAKWTFTVCQALQASVSDMLSSQLLTRLPVKNGSYAIINQI